VLSLRSTLISRTVRTAARRRPARFSFWGNAAAALAPAWPLYEQPNALDASERVRSCF